MNLVHRVVLAAPGDAWDDRWGHMWSRGSGWMWLGGPIMMLFWLAVIVLVVWFVARALTAGPGHPPGIGRSGVERARDNLVERYTRGEITGDEYRERLDRLG